MSISNQYNIDLSLDYTFNQVLVISIINEWRLITIPVSKWVI